KIKLVLEPLTGTTIPIAFSLVLLFLGASTRLVQYLVSLTGSYWLTLGLYLVLFVIFLQIVEIPFSFYSGFIVDHEFGLSTQTLKGWFVDEVKGLGMEVAFGVFAGVVVYYLIRTVSLWWLAAAVLFA